MTPQWRYQWAAWAIAGATLEAAALWKRVRHGRHGYTLSSNIVALGHNTPARRVVLWALMGWLAWHLGVEPAIKR